MKTHLRCLAAVIGIKPKSADGEFTMTSLQATALPFVWLLALRAEICKDHKKPDNAVFLATMPEVASELCVVCVVCLLCV